MEEKLIAALTARVHAFAQGNSIPVLDPQSLTEVRGLLSRGVDLDGHLPIEVTRAVAWLFWCRHLARPRRQDLAGDLQTAIAFFALVDLVAPEEVPDQARQHLAAARHGDVGDPDRDADAAVELLQQAKQRNDPVALNQGISLLRAVVTATPADHPNRSWMLSRLVVALQTRFNLIGTVLDLDEAVRLLREAVGARPTGHPDRPRYLSNLGRTLHVRSSHTGTAAGLDEAVDLLREAVAATPVHHADRPGYLNSLSISLQTRFNRVEPGADLDEAVTTAREAVAATSADHPHRAGYLSSLGLALQARFERTGAVADLDEAVSTAREAIAVTVANHLDRPMYLTHLGNALQTRFGRTGAVADLDEAVVVAQEAVTATPTAHLDRSIYLSNLGGVLWTRFGRTRNGSDLDEAIRLLREAVDALPADHPHRDIGLSRVGTALMARFGRTGAEADLDEAIRLFREAMPANPVDHLDRARCLFNLGHALWARFGRTGAEADLDEAIRLLREATASASADRPDRATFLSNFGGALSTRFERTGAEADLDEAVHSWTLAARSAVAPVAARLVAATGRAHAIARWRGPAAAVAAYTEAVNLLPLLAWRGISHRDQQHLLQTHAASLARDGAACAIAADRLDLAVELLEVGRGVYWSQLLGTRTDLTTLAQAAPELAAQLLECRAILEQPIPEEHTDPTRTQAVEKRMHAARRFDDLVRQVRMLPPTDTFPNPEAFLSPPAARTLLPGSDGGPVVIVNVSRWRCDALLLTHRGIVHVPLPELTEDQVVAEANRYLAALRAFYESGREVEAVRRADRLDLETAVTTTLEWLWDRITAPILTALGHTSTPPTGAWPRLCWCPTGALTVLPVHAAGRHETSDTVLDRVVSSYTPTLRALAQGRTREPSPHPAKILIIALPDTPGQSPLPGTAAERDLLAGCFTPGSRTILTGSDATRGNILTRLDSHRWLHVSCHGTQDLNDPASGGLFPQDWNTAGLITVTDLTSPAHTGGEFAFLSACKTATGGLTILDEGITVAAAMYHAGWRHVIGTLWSVWDDSATDLTRRLYPQLLRSGRLDAGSTAFALHHATREIRACNPARPSTWAPFIHTGP